MVGMADGYAQASGGPTLVNLHTAPGVATRWERSSTPRPTTPARDHRRPAGARRDHDAGQPDQSRRDPDDPSAGQVELRAGARRGRPHALARGPPGDAAAQGPDVRLRADGRLGGRGADDYARAAIERRTTGRAVADPAAIAALARRLEAAVEPGPRRRPRRRRQPGLGRRGAGRAPATPVFAIPAPGGGGSAFPEATRTSAACSRRRSARSPRPSPRTTWCWSPAVGVRLLPVHPGRCCPRGAGWWRSPRTPTRLRGRRWARGDRRGRRPHARALRRGGRRIDRDPGDSLPDPVAGPEEDPIAGTAAMNALGAAFPDDGIVVLEAPSATLALRNQLRISRPGSYYFCAGRGSASVSRPRSGCSWPSPTDPSSASSARARCSTR